MLTVACVLRMGGGLYNESWVYRLKGNLARHLTIPYRLVCLTNLPAIDGVEVLPLEKNWPGWWSKIELFRPGLFDGPVLYVDLDMMACGNIDPLAGPWNGLVMLRDCPAFRQIANSGLMWWDPKTDTSTQEIYHRFSANPMEVMKTYSGVNGVTHFGDQGFTEHTMVAGKPIIKWQDILPEAWFLEFSYLDKLNPLVEANTYDRDVRMCYSLGHPKFSDCPDHPLVISNW